MNCFRRQKGKQTGKMMLVLYCLLFLAVSFLLIKEIAIVSDRNLDRQKDILQDALNHSIVQCYAVEGRYPESMEYLEEHYGIIYDKEKFFVDYEIIGANIMPEVTVMEKK